MGCDASRGRKNWSWVLVLVCWFFSLLFAFFPPPSLHTMFWVRWHPAATVLRTGAAQDRDRGDGVLAAPWSIPNETSSISVGRLWRAARRGHGALADVLEQPISVVLNQKAPQDRCCTVL